ncbi:MAG: flavodoxin family protein [Bacteroides sp.]|nr:flavodoxin family protein [Bacteroides sp.]
MKVVLINGSPRRNGNTFIALTEIANTLQAEGVSAPIIQLGPKPVQGCNNCQKCRPSNVCIFNDPLYAEVRKELEDADGLIIGSPVYYAGPNGALCALIDRVFYSAGSMLSYKVGAAVAICRRGGASATLDRLNKYFSITNMNIVGSQYWNLAHGLAPGEVRQDEEGLQTMRTLGRNMAWTIRNTRAAQQATPQPEKRVVTNFIR